MLRAEYSKELFVTTCIALGLDDPKDRERFKVQYLQIQPYWTDEYTYEWLVSNAYRIKYGDDQL